MQIRAQFSICVIGTTTFVKKASCMYAASSQMIRWPPEPRAVCCDKEEEEEGDWGVSTDHRNHSRRPAGGVCATAVTTRKNALVNAICGVYADLSGIII